MPKVVTVYVPTQGLVPDEGEPPEGPLGIWGGAPIPVPTPPIYIPVEPPHAENPIYIPVFPAHPIELPPGEGLPPENSDAHPEHPIYVPVEPPSGGEAPANPIYIPVYPAHPIVLPDPDAIKEALKGFLFGNLPADPPSVHG
jgi:hypothetical protein